MHVAYPELELIHDDSIMEGCRGGRGRLACPSTELRRVHPFTLLSHS